MYRSLRASRKLTRDDEATVPKVLYDLHQGHAPITLHQAFQDAMDTLEGDGDTQEPAVFVEGCAVPVSAVFGAMLECTDLMPFRIRESVNVVLAAAREGALIDSGDIYARGARLMLSYCRERFGHIPSPSCLDAGDLPQLASN